MLLAMADGWPSPNLNTLSMTDNSVLVVSRPQKEAQSLTTMPAPITSLPLLIVPACGDRNSYSILMIYLSALIFLILKCMLTIPTQLICTLAKT